MRQSAGAGSCCSVPVGCGCLYQQFHSNQKRLREMSCSRLVPPIWFISSSEWNVETLLDETALEDKSQGIPKHGPKALVGMQSVGAVEN